MVQTQLLADANSSRPTGLLAVAEQLANDLSGGRSRRGLLSPGFTRALNAFDGLLAGILDRSSSGLTTSMRAALWGDAATRNHEGGWFTAGQAVAEFAMEVALSTVNPCALPTVARWAYRAYEAYRLIQNGSEAVQNILAGNYLAAGLNIFGMVGNLSQLSRACFTGDMQVITRRGWVRWDALTVDDEVLSSAEHDANGLIEFKRVEELFVTYARIWHLHVANEVIKTTAEHPFYVIGKGWIPCAELSIGDQLRSHNGQIVRAEDVVDGGYEEKVYNCRVADWHTYFVRGGNLSVWAHNSYRETFFNKYPLLKGLVWVHHAIERQVRKFYPGLFTARELDRLSNLRGVPKAINSKLHLSLIRRLWSNFYKKHPDATKNDIRHFADLIDRWLGRRFNPPR